MSEVDQTHDPALKSWVESANATGTPFPIQNLPLGMYRKRGESGPMRGCTAIGDQLLDLAAVGAACEGDLNALAAAGKAEWQRLRRHLSKALSDESERGKTEPFLVPLDHADLGLPVTPRDYSDFFTSYFHAFNAGSLFRPDDPLTPNFKWMPIAYHGRASSFVVSGTDVRRP